MGTLPHWSVSSITSAAQIWDRWQAVTKSAVASAPAAEHRSLLLTEVVADKLRDVVLRWSDGAEDAVPFFLHLPDAVDRLVDFVPGMAETLMHFAACGAEGWP